MMITSGLAVLYGSRFTVRSRTTVTSIALGVKLGKPFFEGSDLRDYLLIV